MLGHHKKGAQRAELQHGGRGIGWSLKCCKVLFPLQVLNLHGNTRPEDYVA